MKYLLYYLTFTFSILIFTRTEAQNVGIGLTNPLFPLTVAANGQGVTQQSTDGSTRVGFYTTPGSAYVLTVTNHPLYFTTANGFPQMTLHTNGNVGIGNSTPLNAGLIVDKIVGSVHALFGSSVNGVAIESNNPGIGLNTYLNGSRKNIGAGYAGLVSLNTNNGDLLLSNSSTSNAADGGATLFPRLTINNLGNVGIGNATPVDAGLVVDARVGAVNAMFGRNTTGVSIESNFPGLGLNTYYNAGRKTISTGFAGLLGLNPGNGDITIYNTAASNVTDAATAITPRLTINNVGNIGVEGNTSPAMPLSFANTIGNKISLYGSSTTSNYGLGIQGSLLQIYSPLVSADIAFGYGGSSNFTENMRIKGNGNVGIGTSSPAFSLDMLGRARLRNDGATSPGIWFNKPDETQGSFIGQYDATNFGVWGPGAVGTWKFLFDGSDGTLRIGTTQKATGYLVNVGGKLIAEEVRVQVRASWPDYVFKKDHLLMPIKKLEQFIADNNHLPGFKTAEMIEKEGSDLGETQRKMMEKIEELTLYIIQQDKRIDALQKNLDESKNNVKN